MSHFHTTVSQLGFSLALSLTVSVAWATEEPRAKIVDHAVLASPQATSVQIQGRSAARFDPSEPEQHPQQNDVTVQPLIDTAYGGRANSDRATDSSKDASRRRYFAMRRLAETRGGGSGYWRWIETERRANSLGSRAAPRDGYDGRRYGNSGGAQPPYSTRPNWNPNWAYPNGAARRYPPSAAEPYPAFRPYRYQSANGYGYLR